MKLRLIYDVLHNFFIKHKWSFRKSFLMAQCDAKFEITWRCRDLVKDLNRDINIPAKFKNSSWGLWDLTNDAMILPVHDVLCQQHHIRKSELWPPFNLNAKRVQNIIYRSKLRSFNSN